MQTQILLNISTKTLNNKSVQKLPAVYIRYNDRFLFETIYRHLIGAKYNVKEQKKSQKSVYKPVIAYFSFSFLFGKLFTKIKKTR